MIGENMFRYDKDLNEFNALCEAIGDGDPDHEPQDGDMDVDLPGQEDEADGYAFLDKVKAVIKSYQKVGNTLEALLRDTNTPDDFRNYLVDLDKQISQIYMRLYQFGHKVKVKSFQK